jgi:phytoene dehydrogenase-like protein
LRLDCFPDELIANIQGEDMQNYDVIVIGAGNAGLTAAATLSQKGLNVLLLERHNIPGGSATSFCRGRFEFEVARKTGPPAINPGSARSDGRP